MNFSAEVRAAAEQTLIEIDGVQCHVNAADFTAGARFTLSSALVRALRHALAGYDCPASRNRIKHAEGVACDRCDAIAAYDKALAGEGGEKYPQPPCFSGPPCDNPYCGCKS